MNQPTFSILITTKNRLPNLVLTLEKIAYLINNENVECIICDDGSTDGTYEFIQQTYPKIHIFRNQKSKGLIYSRNKLMEATAAKYAISLDDDLHFITENPLEIIERIFNSLPLCGVISFRIFWSTSKPISISHSQKMERIKSFAGGAHVWRMEAWKAIPNYPSWFVFYGEEYFASYNLFKQKKEIYYVPDILCHHRVNLKARQKDKDYKIRLRRSLRAGWYLYLLFYPLHLVPRKFMYSLWIQLKTRVFKGETKAFVGICQAIFDVIINMPKLIKNRNALTNEEFKEFSKLSSVKLYWKPEDESA